MQKNESNLPGGYHKTLGALIAVVAVATLGVLCARLAFADTLTAEPWGLDTPAGRCVVCHSLEKGGPFRVAPNLWGIVGDEKARDRGWYAYSPALIRMGGTWTEKDLDQFLANADAFAPGTTKSIQVIDAEERQAIIEFLKGLQ
jgi:cytochrome c